MEDSSIEATGRRKRKANFTRQTTSGKDETETRQRKSGSLMARSGNSLSVLKTAIAICDPESRHQNKGFARPQWDDLKEGIRLQIVMPSDRIHWVHSTAALHALGVHTATLPGDAVGVLLIPKDRGRHTSCVRTGHLNFRRRSFCLYEQRISQKSQ